jgi:hypothetical protein
MLAIEHAANDEDTGVPIRRQGRPNAGSYMTPITGLARR